MFTQPFWRQRDNDDLKWQNRALDHQVRLLQNELRQSRNETAYLLIHLKRLIGAVRKTLTR